MQIAREKKWRTTLTINLFATLVYKVQIFIFLFFYVWFKDILVCNCYWFFDSYLHREVVVAIDEASRLYKKKLL